MTAKKAVISGASRGIGKACAEAFIKNGYAVAVCASSADNLKSMSDEIHASYPEAVLHTHVTDLADTAQVKEFAHFVTNTLGTPDVLVNNGGTFTPGSILEEEEGALEHLMNVNLFSAYHLSRALIPGMIQAGHGHVFNMCSVASLYAYPNGGSYSITKFALLGMSKVLREELKEKNIKVTSLVPGATYTDSWKASGLPEERFMKAEDIAKVIMDAIELSDGAVVEEILLRPQLGDI